MNVAMLFLRIVNNPKGVRFAELARVAQAFGFALMRTSGSHRIYRHAKSGAMMNFQNCEGMAKPYQVRQFLDLVETYNLEIEDAGQ